MTNVDAIIARKILGSSLAHDVAPHNVHELKEAASPYVEHDTDGWDKWHIDFKRDLTCTLVFYATEEGIKTRVKWSPQGSASTIKAIKQLEFMLQVASLGEDIANELTKTVKTL